MSSMLDIALGVVGFLIALGVYLIEAWIVMMILGIIIYTPYYMYKGIRRLV